MTDAPQDTRSYHHGNLEQALIAAALALIEEQGLEAVSVREVARRAGVSPGAPFRHFASKALLMTAVAEQAMQRLADAVRDRLARLDGSDPMSALHEMGHAYVDWVVANRTHFLVISSRSEIAFETSARLIDQNEELRLGMLDLLRKAQAQGQIRAGLDLDALLLATRAVTYGAARLWADGHFPQWQVYGAPQQAMSRMIDLFLTSISVANQGGVPAQNG